MTKKYTLKSEKTPRERKSSSSSRNRGQLLNRASLEVARLASTDDDRPTLCVLRITPECTIATNGQFLGRITHPVVDRDVVEENAPVEIVDRPIRACSIPRHVALDLARLIPKTKADSEQPHHFAFFDLENSTAKRLRAVVKQADAVQSVEIGDVQMEFPDTGSVIPKRQSGVMRFALNRWLLDVVLGAARRMGLDAELRFTIPDSPEKPILIEGGIRATEQEATFVIMPMRSDKVAEEAAPRGESKPQ